MHRCDAVVLICPFEYRLRQLLDEQGHAVGAVDDFLDEFGAERGVAGKAVDEGSYITRTEPVQRQRCHMRLPAPGRLKLRSEGNDQQNRHPSQAIDR